MKQNSRPQTLTHELNFVGQEPAAHFGFAAASSRTIWKVIE